MKLITCDCSQHNEYSHYAISSSPLLLLPPRQFKAKPTHTCQRTNTIQTRVTYKHDPPTRFTFIKQF
jgi:hypothetical protein